MNHLWTLFLPSTPIEKLSRPYWNYLCVSASWIPWQLSAEMIFLTVLSGQPREADFRCTLLSCACSCFSLSLLILSLWSSSCAPRTDFGKGPISLHGNKTHRTNSCFSDSWIMFAIRLLISKGKNFCLCIFKWSWLRMIQLKIFLLDDGTQSLCIQ